MKRVIILSIDPSVEMKYPWPSWLSLESSRVYRFCLSLHILLIFHLPPTPRHQSKGAFWNSMRTSSAARLPSLNEQQCVKFFSLWRERYAGTVLGGITSGVCFPGFKELTNYTSRYFKCSRFFFFFNQYLSRGIQFSRASLNGALT